MKIKISHLPDKVEVDGPIFLVAKSSENYDDFAVVAAKNRDHLYDWLPWAKNTPDESSVEHYTTAPEKKQQNESVDWNIYNKDNLVGAVGLMARNKDPYVLEVGYWLAKDSEGQGIISKCVNAIVDLAFNETEATAIEIGCDKTNDKSAAVAKRCGFKLHHEAKREFPIGKGRLETDDGLYFWFTREDWEATKAEQPL